MSLKYTPATLKKFDELFDEISYTIRYEKGNFQSGYCIIQDKKVAVINKFLTLEGRINALIDILPTLSVDTEILSSESRQFYELVLSNPTNK